MHNNNPVWRVMVIRYDMDSFSYSQFLAGREAFRIVEYETGCEETCVFGRIEVPLNWNHDDVVEWDVYMEYYAKWDGCVERTYPDDGLIHLCDRDSVLREMQMLRDIWDLTCWLPAASGLDLIGRHPDWR